MFVWTSVCSFGRSFVRLDDCSFVWTIVRSFEHEILKLKNFGNFRVIFGYYPTIPVPEFLGYPTLKKSGTGKLWYGYYPRVIFTRFFTRHTLAHNFRAFDLTLIRATRDETMRPIKWGRNYEKIFPAHFSSSLLYWCSAFRIR